MLTHLSSAAKPRPKGLDWWVWQFMSGVCIELVLLVGAWLGTAKLGFGSPETETLWVTTHFMAWVLGQTLEALGVPRTGSFHPLLGVTAIILIQSTFFFALIRFTRIWIKKRDS
jgi:hypothetical protein